MSEVIRFPGHHWAHCTDPECNGCMLCHGGLGLCTTCGGLEGSLTTHCPGKRMLGDVPDDVYAGKIDFKDGEWVYAPSIHTPHKHPTKPSA